jgi:hypothetical protein
MADFDGMLMLGEANIPTSGGVFVLDKPCLTNSVLDVGDGWETEVRENGRCILARGRVLGTYEEAREQAILAVQRGLDLLCIRGFVNLTTTGIGEEHIVWWQGDQGMTLRVYGVTTQNFQMSGTLTVLDPSGNVVPQPPAPNLAWHDSFRYFRLSQTTDDLFEAYRSLFLALESILSEIVPVRTYPNEGETDWFRRAFQEIAARGLFNFVSIMPSAADPVTAARQDLVGNRNASFHAKNHRSHLTPHDPVSRQALNASLERLSRLYLTLVSSHLGVQRRESGMTRIGFDLTTAHLNQGLIIHVSDDDAPFNPADQVINPTGGNVVMLSTRFAPELAQPFLKTFLGTCPVTAMMPLTHVARLATTFNDQPFSNCTLEGCLTLTGFEVFEAVMGLRLRNIQQPKAIYSM